MTAATAEPTTVFGFTPLNPPGRPAVPGLADWNPDDDPATRFGKRIADLGIWLRPVASQLVKLRATLANICAETSMSAEELTRGMVAAIVEFVPLERGVLELWLHEVALQSVAARDKARADAGAKARRDAERAERDRLAAEQEADRTMRAGRSEWERAEIARRQAEEAKWTAYESEQGAYEAWKAAQAVASM